MPEVFHVYATVRLPNGDNDPGQVTTGYYTLADGILTMTDSKGTPVRDLNSGEKVTHKLAAGDDAAVIARRLTMKIHRMLRGESGPAGFNRPLSYLPAPA
jgi:hypothetical protein